MVYRRQAWGSPFESEVEDKKPSGNEALDHHAAIEKSIAKAFKGIDTFGELKILNIDGLIPKKRAAGSRAHDAVRPGHATVLVEFAKRRAGAPKWATIELDTDREGTWQAPSVMTIQGRGMLIDQAVFDDWFGSFDSPGADNRDATGWRGPDVETSGMSGGPRARRNAGYDEPVIPPKALYIAPAEPRTREDIIQAILGAEKLLQSGHPDLKRPGRRDAIQARIRELKEQLAAAPSADETR